MPTELQWTLNAATRFCAVLGHPVRHSASPAMQNAAIAQLGLNWRYLALEVHPYRLRDAIAGAKAMRFIGLNLTVPHKLLAMDMVDSLDASAQQWGAVNTVRFEAQDGAGRWRGLGELENPDGKAGPDISGDAIRAHGFNTDGSGLARALREDLGMKLAGAKVLLLGAGGAGRVAALKLASEGAAELHLVNRSPDKAEALAVEIGKRFPGAEAHVGYPSGKVDLLLNATSLGLKPGDASPLDGKKFPMSAAAAVYDMIYRPAETELLKSAKAAGCRVANGAGMLLHQGAEALEIWTGRPAPLEVMRSALMRDLYG